MADCKIRTLFYRPKWFDGKIVDNTINTYTKPVNLFFNPAHMKEGFFERWRIINLLACSHAEKWWPDEYGNFKMPFGNGGFIFRGEMFTSTMGQIGGKNRTGDGTIIRPASEILKHPERWFYSEMEVAGYALDIGKTWARTMVDFNLGYDGGDIGKLFHPNENKRRQNIYDFMLICSGACWAFDCKVADFWQQNEHNYRPRHYIAGTILEKLVEGRFASMLPSPLLYALWQYMAGVKFYDLKTSKPIQLK